MKRRTFVLASGSIFGVPAIHAQGRKAVVKIGWNPLAGATAITATMQQQQLVEKAAQQYGYELEVSWVQFLSGPPATEAMVAGRLDIDLDVASAALNSRISNDVPFAVLGTHASHLSNAIMVRRGSGIDDVAKLSGKTVALPIGTSAHYTLASIVSAVLGKTISEAGIKLVNMSPADAIKMPSGVDACAVWVPVRYLGPSLGTAELLVDADGWTGKGHKTPGVRLPEVQKAWGWPEGFFVDRLYASVRAGFLKEHPNLAKAFLEARWTAQDLVAASREKSVELANSYWKQPADIAQQSFFTYPENTNIRTAPVVLESDAMALVKTSEFFAASGLTSKPLSWSAVMPFLTPTAVIQREVWEKRKSLPSLEQLAAGFKGTPPIGAQIEIQGGAPIWAADANWGSRIYKPGPFGRKS